MTSEASNTPIRLPEPDPCIVDIFFVGWEWPWGVKKRHEKAWIEARKCPLGCGEKCKRLAA